MAGTNGTVQRDGAGNDDVADGAVEVSGCPVAMVTGIVQGACARTPDTYPLQDITGLTSNRFNSHRG